MRELETMAEVGGPVAEDEAFDDRLALLFMCCHPALPLAGRVALTLKTVTGLSTREIARAFVATEATMSKRLLRTKQKITNAGISFRMPPAHRLAERTTGVLAVVYLLFNEGYAATEGTTLPSGRRVGGGPAGRVAGGAAARRRRGGRAPRAAPAAAFASRCPGRGRRRAADDGGAGPRTLGPRLDRTRSRGAGRARAHARPAGPYRLQAEIAARHATAATADETDWASIVALYDVLLETPNPVVALNRAVAIGFRDGPDAGLAALDEVDLPGYHLVEATRGEFLRRAGRPREAAAAYRHALDLVGTDAERRLLERRLVDVGG